MYSSIRNDAFAARTIHTHIQIHTHVSHSTQHTAHITHHTSHITRTVKNDRAVLELGDRALVAKDPRRTYDPGLAVIFRYVGTCQEDGEEGWVT